MAGIKHLSEIYTKKGKEFLQNLFNETLLVTEKADGSSFQFQKGTDGKLVFYKRDDRNPISLLDRTLMRFYEKPIGYVSKFENLDLPTDLRFSFEYFQNTKPVSIAYDRLPKNNLILTHIKKVNPSGKIVDIIDDLPTLQKWARTFEVESIYVIFEGKLKKEQQEQIFNFLETPFDDLVNRFKTDSFTRYIISILNPSLKTTALSSGIDNPIEGLVFKFKNLEFLAKLVDPVFTNAAKVKAKERIEKTDTNDQYAILLNSFISWFEDFKLETISPLGTTEDEKYIDVMLKLAMQYVYDNHLFLKDVDIEVPEFAKVDDFRLNKEIIQNKEIVKFLDNNENYEPIFRIMLSGFKKVRVRKTNMIDDVMKGRINNVVNIISNKIKTTNESFLSFDEWLKLQKYN